MPMIGQTFSPLNTPPPGQPGSSPASPLQDAIKLLNFRLPTVVGAGAPSGVLGPPTALGAQGPLQGVGSANNWLMQLLMRLIPNAGQPPAGPEAPGVPMPPPMAPPMGPAPAAVHFPTTVGRIATQGPIGPPVFPRAGAAGSEIVRAD